jgi:hypothetical protein
LSDQKGNKRDPPECRPDLVKKAAEAGKDFTSAFDWVSDKEELRVQNDARNQGLETRYIRELALNWVLDGNEIRCVPEQRSQYRDERHFHYDITIEVDGFSHGLYVEMDLANCDEDDPSVRLLNAHPPSFY